LFQKLLLNKGFAEKLEHWRNRATIAEVKSDIYDGAVWKGFQSEKYEHFFTHKRSVGLMLSMDFFQPYKHVMESFTLVL